MYASDRHQTKASLNAGAIGAGAIELAGTRAPKFLTAGVRGGLKQIYRAP